MDPKFTRHQYLAKECTHQEYYGQFCSKEVVNFVVRAIGRKKLLNSQDEHFNDIPLKRWDQLEGQIRVMCGRAINRANNPDGYKVALSLSDTVCTAKQAARIFVDRERKIVLLKTGNK